MFCRGSVTQLYIMNPLGRVGNESISIGTYLCCAFIPKSENPYLYLKALLTSVFFFSLFGFSWIAIPKYLYPWVAILPFYLSFYRHSSFSYPG